MSLLRLTGQAVQALGKKAPEDGDGSVAEKVEGEGKGEGGSEDQIKVFQDSVNDFFRTLRRVNVGMKRQIWGLEEEGIITLRKEDNSSSTGGATVAGATTGGGADAPAAAQKARLEPDGDGKIGGLDPGWLNSRSNTVEREMEAELWDKAEAFLRDILAKQVSIPTGTDAQQHVGS